MESQPSVQVKLAKIYQLDLLTLFGTIEEEQLTQSLEDDEEQVHDTRTPKRNEKSSKDGWDNEWNWDEADDPQNDQMQIDPVDSKDETKHEARNAHKITPNAEQKKEKKGKKKSKERDLLSGYEVCISRGAELIVFAKGKIIFIVNIPKASSETVVDEKGYLPKLHSCN